MLGDIGGEVGDDSLPGTVSKGSFPVDLGRTRGSRSLGVGESRGEEKPSSRSVLLFRNVVFLGFTSLSLLGVPSFSSSSLFIWESQVQDRSKANKI